MKQTDVSHKLLTLIVPTYNMERYLDKCLASLIVGDAESELMRSLEVLVVNDGSKDRSSKIAHGYESRFPHTFRVIDKENGNYGSCVNRGLAEAQGKYVRMLDADDWFHTVSLISLLGQLEDIEVDLIITESEDRRSDGSLLWKMQAPDSIPKGVILDATKFDAQKEGFRFLYCSHLLIYRTSLLREIGLQLQTGISYTDNEYVFFPLDRIKTMIFYDLPLYQYLIGREGQTTQSIVMYRDSWQLEKVIQRLLIYYQERQDHTPFAVVNNQRLVLAEMFKWLYGPMFDEPYSAEKKQKFIDTFLRYQSETVIYDLLDGFYCQNYFWFRLYRSKGIYIGDRKGRVIHFLANARQFLYSFGIRTKIRNLIKQLS